MTVALRVYFDSRPLELSLWGLEEFLEDRSPARNRIKADLAETIDQYFEQQTGPYGRWEPLNPKYVAWKRARGFDTRILHKTLTLRETIQVSANDGGDQGMIEALSDLDYAATQHFGDYREAFGNGTMVYIPARPFLDITPQKEDQYLAIYLSQLDQAWDNNPLF